MSKYYVTDTELASVADAIRTKGGTSADLEFPSGFVTAIGNISGGGSPNLQAKTNIDATTSSQTITADDGYDGLSSVQINALDGQAAQTIHPSTSDQTIASGKYLTGAQTVKGVLLTNLDAGNIKKDVVVKIGDSTDDDCVTSVTGTYEGGGSGLTYESGSITITTDTSYLIVTGLGGTPKFIKFIIHDAATNVGDHTLKSVSGVYVMGACVVRATNNAGSGYGYTAFGTEAAWEASTQTVYEDETKPAANGQIYATTSGFSAMSYSGSYSFKPGYTFDWQVWY